MADYPTPKNAIIPTSTSVYDPNAGRTVAPTPVPTAIPAPTADQLARRTADATTTNPTTDTASPYYPRYTAAEQAAVDTLSAPVTAKTEDQIVAEKTAAAQAQIDALSKHYADLAAEQQTINEGRNRATSSVNTLTGLAGSTEANIAANKTTALNQKESTAIENQKNADIQSILTGIRSSAVQEAQQSRQEARQSATDILALRTQRQTEAVDHLTNLAKAGATLDGLKSTLGQQEYNYLVNNVGGETQVQSLLTLNRPQETVLDKSIQNGKYVIAYQNPIDGKVRIESTDLGIPPGYSKTIDAGNRILAVPDNWDGDPSKLISINKGLTPTQQQSAGNSSDANPQLYNGLSAHTSTAVRARVNKYATDNTIQNYSTVQDGYNFANSLDTKTQNPADDQALIYSLAKALDPGSVVREGEYATAQKYAQSWIAAYGTGIQQAILGTGFLSQTARENIKKTIEEKYKAQKMSYDQTRNSYVQGINALTGRNDGEKFLTDYITPNNDTSASGSQTITAPDGTQVQITD